MVEHATLLGLIFDINGTIVNDYTPMDGAIEAINELRKVDGVRLGYLTNNSREGKASLVARLQHAGFDFSPREIVTSRDAAYVFIKRERLTPMYLLEADADEQFADLPAGEFNAVLVGLAPSKFDFENLDAAYQLLRRGAPLLATHRAATAKTAAGCRLSVGPFVSLLEAAAGVTARVFGKPSEEFFSAAAERLAVERENCCVVGDDWNADVDGARKLGFKAVLVRTGRYEQGDELRVRGGCQVVDSVSDVPRLLLNSS